MWCQTSGSRSLRRRRQAWATEGRSKIESTLSSPVSTRRAASRAARSTRRAAKRLEASEPVEGTESHSSSRSARAISAKASASADTPLPMGRSSASATRARIAGPVRPRRLDCARSVATSTNVAALPSFRPTSTRRPSSRFSSLGGSAAASSYTAPSAWSGLSQPRSSRRPLSRAALVLSRSREGSSPSRGTGVSEAAAAARVAKHWRNSARRSSPVRRWSRARPSSWTRTSRIRKRAILRELQAVGIDDLSRPAAGNP
jgi:hypothetical protein